MISTVTVPRSVDSSTPWPTTSSSSATPTVGGHLDAAADTTNVAHLVYVAAFCLEVDESVLGFSRVQPDQDYAFAKALVLAEDGTTVTIAPSLAEVFYGDCTDNQAAAAIRARSQPLATFTQAQRSAPWKVLPSTYVLAERDNAVPRSHQEVMAPRCSTVVWLDCDHSPFMSHDRPARRPARVPRVGGEPRPRAACADRRAGAA